MATVFAASALAASSNATADVPSVSHTGVTRPSGTGQSQSTPTPSQPVVGRTPGASHSGTASDTQVGLCRAVVTAFYFGPYCPSAGGNTGGGKLATVKEILGGDPLPGCWDSALTPNQLDEYRIKPGATYTWFLRKCVTWLVANPVYPYPTSVRIEDGLVALPAGSAPLTLTDKQRVLVDLLTKAQGSYPTVIVVPTGSGVARVNQHVAFHATPALTGVVDAGGVFMQARVIKTIIRPLGTNGPTVACDGTGAVPSPSVSPDATTPGSVCWFTFTATSADQPNQAYPMVVTVTWDVRSTANPATSWDTWTDLNNTITVTHITNQRVTQIQVLNVPNPPGR